MQGIFKTFYQRLAAARVFANWAPGYDADVKTNRYSAANAVAGRLEPLIRPDSAITDLGIGTGLIWADIDIPEDAEITGLDLSQDMLALASANPALGPLYRCDVARHGWPVDDASQDIVTAAGLFEYLTEPMARHVFNEARRVLKPGGRFILTYIPDAKNRASLWHGRSGRILSCRFAPAWIEAQAGFDAAYHSEPFAGSQFADGSRYDYRLIELVKRA